MSDEEKVQGEMEPENVPTSMQDLLETAGMGSRRSSAAMC